MKKLLILLAILAMVNVAQAALPALPAAETFDTDVFAGPSEFTEWGKWASGSGSGTGWIGGSPGAGTSLVVTTGGNPGGAMEIIVAPAMTWWGRSMGFVHNNALGAIHYGVNVTADAKNIGPASGLVIKIEWYGGRDKATTLGLASTLITGIGTAWTPVTFSGVAPVGANYFSVCLVAEGVAAGYLVDNVTPEPMTIALLGLGGLFLRRRK